ncbi:MAG: S24/S26 family peptidase [Clostridia bacterium]|nr:S24/S26 family peptidase [Clostridia bacterium]
MTEKEAFLAQNGYYLSAPTGKSMHPFIRGGKDLVTVVLPTRALRRLDAVLYYRSNGEHVIHRIVGKKDGVYLIRGDNCYYTERVPSERVIGVVENILRNNEKKIDVEHHRLYRLAVWLWCAVYPLRYACSPVPRGVRKLRRILKERTR